MATKLFEFGDDDSSGEEYKRATKRDFLLAKDCGGLKNPVVPRAALGSLIKDAEIITLPDIAALEDFAKRARRTIYFDFETNQKRPYGPKPGRILSVALTDGVQTLSMPLQHPEVPVPDLVLAKIKAALINCFRNRRVFAHNLAFDLEWAVYFLGIGVCDVVDEWHCTDVGAYILDTRVGKSLDYLTRLYFGYSVKSLSPGELWNEHGAVKKLLEYGAADVVAGYDVACEQWDDLLRFGRVKAYRYHMRRIPELVSVQRRGMPISAKRVAEYRLDFEGQIKSLVADFSSQPAIQEYEQRFGKFLPSSSDAAIKLFRDVLHREEGVRGDKYSTDASVLESLADIEPVAGMLLKHRGLVKQLGTYVVRFEQSHAGTYVYPDGLLHYQLLSTFTQTRRLSCRDPNGQNWPKRKRKEARRIVEAPEGWVIVSIDLGQIEARCFAMESRDPEVVRIFTDDYDVHAFWAEKLLAAAPQIMRQRGLSDFKAWRACVKNEFVFPLFFGAGAAKVSARSQIAERLLRPVIDEFWNVFKGVKKWQRKQVRFYEKNFYVESLTGFRRYGPMKYNMIINTPIQNPAADFCAHALVAASRRAREREQPWWCPVISIHDDNTWIVPESAADSFIEEAVKLTLNLPYDFINVPLTCEVEKGPNWCDMSPVGVFRSDQL
jgi:DNA polymerase I-like protein with 3'-5' exonuclease and polymerase domains